MVASALLTTLRAKGVELVAAGDKIRFRPSEVVTSEELLALRVHKREILALLAHHAPPSPPGPNRPDSRGFAEAVTRFLGMPLHQFAREGAFLEIEVPWLEVTLFFVPTEADMRTLTMEGISRGRVWTARELMDLLAIPRLTPQQAQTVALAKLEFGGEVVAVRSRARSRRRKDTRER